MDFFAIKNIFLARFVFFPLPFFAVVFYCNVGKSSEKRMYERGKREEGGAGGLQDLCAEEF